jgi:alkylation response protein AidB-like acyl-CoA dehydrogenase
MDFSLTEEQRMLEDSLEKYVQAQYSLADRRKYAANDAGFERANWQEFAEMGWLMLPFAEEDGGIGAGPVELMVLMEAFGRGLVLEPYLATVILAGGLIRRAGSREQKNALLPELQEGRLLMAFAYAEQQSRFNLFDVETEATEVEVGFRIKGRKIVVIHGNSADKLILSARTQGDSRDLDGISLFLVNADAPGLQRRNYPTVDGLMASEIEFDNVFVGSDALLGELHQGAEAIEAVMDEAILAVCCEALGVMDALNKATIDYLREREQFDQPLSKFQALQHRMVDMFVEYEQARSLLFLAVAKMEEGADDAHKWLSALKYKVAKAGRFISQQAVQLHGGMGMTDELVVSHYFKRLMVIETLFGNADFHLQRFAAMN